MNTDFKFRDKTLYLERYPVKHQHKSLQAWDASDEYVINHIEDLMSDGQLNDMMGQTMILNDDFGALTTWFYDQRPYVLNDSWVSQKSAKVNLKHNEQPTNHISFISSVDDLTTLNIPTLKVVILKLPRSMAYLEHQLIQLQSVIDTNTLIIACGKVKAVQTSVLKMFEKHLGDVKTSLAKKKARLIFAQYTGIKSEQPAPIEIKDSAVDFKLTNLANVFSREQLDVGARLLLKHMPICEWQSVIDLGCGNGILGIQVLQDNPSANVTFVDESFMAVESARLNLLAMQGHTENAKFVVSNCLDEVLKKHKASYDQVLCNPPFHQQNVITDHIAYQMFIDSKRALKPEGQIRVVANRHLDYPHKLNKVFDGFDVLGSNEKFSVMRCIA